MIPKFNKYGYLSKGIHKAMLNEIEKRFGSHSQRRRELFERFKSLVQLLCKHKDKIEKFLLDGSFVTAKEVPEDLDCILIVKDEFDFDSSEAKQLLAAEKLFKAHLFTFLENDGVRYRKLIDFFGHDRERKTKGLVEVII